MAPLTSPRAPGHRARLTRADLASICNDITFAAFFVEGRNEQSLIGVGYVKLMSFYYGEALGPLMYKIPSTGVVF